MSDEEKCSDGTYVRHPPMYRSEKFSSFLKKLDERADKATKQHARFQRKEGSPCDIPVPTDAKTWMIKECYRLNEDQHDMSMSGDDSPAAENLFDNGDTISEEFTDSSRELF